MTTWPRRTYIALDTETTGLVFDEDRIIQIGIAVFYKGEYVHGWEWLSNVGRPSHPDAVATHGIIDEYRYENGESPRRIFPQIMSLVHRMQEAKQPIVVFNSPFDFSFLQRECEITGASFYKEQLYVVDPLVIDRHFEKNVPVFTKPWMRQQQMAARYGVGSSNHTALADAIIAGKIAYAQTLHHPGIRNASVPELHRCQEQWYEEWAKIFISFARKKEFSVSIPGWPFGNANARKSLLEQSKLG